MRPTAFQNRPYLNVSKRLSNRIHRCIKCFRGGRIVSNVCECVSILDLLGIKYLNQVAG